MTSNDSVKKHTKTRYHRFSISLSVLVIINAVQFAGGEKLCSAPRVVKGSSANITCSFDKNVPMMQGNLFLEHLAFSALDHEIVVTCQVAQGKYACRGKYGYQVVDNITDVMVVEIRKALPEHAGIYWCGGFQSNPLSRPHCRLNVTDEFNLNLGTTECPNVKQIIVGNFTFKQEIITEDIMTTCSVPIVLAVIITTVIICALTIIVIVSIRCYRRTRKHVDKEISSEKTDFTSLVLEPSMTIAGR